MVGYLNKEIERAIYRDYIQEMDDDRLEEEARDYNWMCETALGGPRPIDTWKRDFVKAELEKRDLEYRYRRARVAILSQLSRA